MVLLNDVVDAYTAYAKWVFSGKENEDLRDDLKDDLVGCLQGFFFSGDEVNESNVQFANANSDLGVRFDTCTITIEIPDSDEEDDYIPLTVSAD
jgi:hypothetical protein